MFTPETKPEDEKLKTTIYTYCYKVERCYQRLVCDE